MKKKQHAFYRANLDRVSSRNRQSPPDTTISTAHVISGGSTGGPEPPLISDETEARTALKKFLRPGSPHPPYLRVFWMTGPPYLKV